MMMTEITHNENGTSYRAEYEVFEETLVVYLPDGSTRETVLRGLKPNTAAMHHLRAYAQGQK